MRLYSGMRAAKPVSAKTASWDATAGSLGARTLPYRSQRLRRDERQTKTTRSMVVLSLFLVLLAAALLVGGRSLIDPQLQLAAVGRDANRVGEIILTMPDGKFCRHLSFDNKTAVLVEGAIEQCAPDRPKDRAGLATGFSWGAR